MNLSNLIAKCLVLGASILAGCQTSTTKFTVGKETFATQQQALTRLDQWHEVFLAGISATKTPIGGTAMVAIPTRELFMRMGITTSGPALSPKDQSEVNDYLAQYSDREWTYYFKAVELRRIFDKVVLLRSDAPEEGSLVENDFVIYYRFLDHGSAQWYIRGKTWSAPKPIFSDPSEQDGTASALLWLDYLEKTARNPAEK